LARAFALSFCPEKRPRTNLAEITSWRRIPMAAKTGKTWMFMDETDNPNAVIESYEDNAVKGDPFT